MFGGALVLILGALAVGSGYGWGTWKTVFTQGPSGAAAVAGLLLPACGGPRARPGRASPSTYGVATVIAAGESQPIAMPSLDNALIGILTGTAILGMWTLAGALIGAIARGPALAVGLGLVWVLVVENLLRGVAGIFGPIEAVTNLLPGTAAGSLAGAMRTVEGPANPGVLDILTRGESLALLAAYVTAFAGGTIWLMTRRDLT